MLGTMFQINHFLKKTASCISNMHLRHKDRQNCGQPIYISFVIGELLSLSCHGVCSDLLALSLFILNYVETSLSGKSRLGCGKHVDDKAFHSVFYL